MGKKWTELKAGDVHRAMELFLGALGENAGLVTNKINTHPNYLARLAYKAVDEAQDYKPNPHPFTGDGNP